MTHWSREENLAGNHKDSPFSIFRVGVSPAIFAVIQIFVLLVTSFVTIQIIVKEFENMQHSLPKCVTVIRNIVYKEIFHRTSVG